ncbi:MAG: DUF4062 domain-containing protein [Paenibacillaceae bacterium]|nr:DUF4062 domain-containing protein [Paenibacillaceae bacterium]
MEKRYQIFVSSTFEDLVDERKRVIETILNFNHIPAGMELFTASNDEQFEYIKKIMHNCDYYILIVGGRYGTINPDKGISYTEQEYLYALELGLPILAFLHETPYDLPSKRRDDENRILFDAFLKKVKTGKMIKYWSNIDNLTSSVLLGLNYEFNNNPRLGWVRGGESNSAELLKQINDLRLEKETIEKKYMEVKETLHENQPKFENLAEMSEVYTVRGIEMDENGDSNFYEDDFDFTWNDIFKAIGPHLNPCVKKDIFEKIVKCNLGYYGFEGIRDECIQTIRIQLYAQGLIYQDTISGSLHIGLTQKGEVYLLQIMTIKTQK